MPGAFKRLENEKPQSTHKPHADIKGIEDRHCTDVCCLLLFVVMWIGLLSIGIFSFFNGDLASIEYGSDYMGNRCGMGNFSDRPVVWYPRFARDVAEQAGVLAKHPTALVLYGLCLSECPTRPHVPIRDYGWGVSPQAQEDYWAVAMSTFNGMHRCVPMVETNTTHRRYCEFPSCDDLDLPCVAVVGVSNTLWEMSMEEQDEKCMREIEIEQVTETKTPIDTEAAATGVLISYVLSFATTLNNALDMLKDNALQIFVFGIGFATLFGFGWMILLFVCAGFAVYFSLLMVALILLGVTILFAYKGNVGGPLVTTFFQSVVNGTIVQLDNMAHDTVVEGLLHSDMVETAIHVTMSQESDLQQLYQILAAVALLLLIIYLTLLGVASGQISRTVALVKEATLCVHNSKAMVFFPLVISFFHLVLVLFIAFTLAYLHTNPATSYSSQLAAISESYTTAHDEIAEGLAAMNADMTNVAEKDVVGDWLNALQYLDADQILFFEDCYIVFGLVWSYFFLAAIGTTTISGCVIYYFFMDADTAGHINDQFADNQTNYVVTTMFYYTLRYNLGSMALGSFVLAVVETLVAALEFVENQTKAEQQSNPVMKVVLKCCKCCLFCFERCLKFVSSYAYIFVFMQNTGFCMACYRTWRMMSQYPVQLSINSVVQKVLFAMQSISIPLMCTGWAYWSFLSSSGQLKHGFAGVSSDVLIAAGLPAFCVFVLSMLVARSFASVYEQVVTALTTCVLTDIEQYRARYARSQLREAFDLPVKKISLDDDFDDGNARQAKKPASQKNKQEKEKRSSTTK